MPDEPLDPAAEVVAGVVVPDGDAEPVVGRVVATVVDAWRSKAPKHTSRLVTLLGVAPLLVLPLVLMATRLPMVVRPVLVVLALVLTGYTYWRSRRPGWQTYEVDTTGRAVTTPAHREVLLPFASLGGLRIELSGPGAGRTCLVFTPTGPYRGAGVTEPAPDGQVRLWFPQPDAPRLDAALRAAGAPGYRGIVRASAAGKGSAAWP